MPRYRVSKRTIEITSIVVEAESEEALFDEDNDEKFDSLWENAEWHECGDGPYEVEEVKDTEPLTEPYKPARQEDIDKVLAYVKGEG